MTTTRPLFPRYKAILTALTDGPCFARDLVAQGIHRPGMALPNLIASGCVERMSVRDVPDPSRRGPRPVWRYTVTAEGRAVLESGVLPRKVPGAGWNAGTPRRPTLVLDPARCVHYWLIGNDVQQSATCAKCKATKEFRSPFLVLGNGTRTRQSDVEALIIEGMSDSTLQAHETLHSTAEAG